MDKRLIDCSFIKASSFTKKLSNKAKLLYIYMFVNADDKGFVSNTMEIIDTLTSNDDKRGYINLELTNNDYISALIELTDRKLLYEFKDNYDNSIFLIRAWYIHNVYRKGMATNYNRFLREVEIIDNEYHLKSKETHLKENKEKKEINKVNKVINTGDEEWDNMMNEVIELEKKENINGTNSN